MISFKKNKAEVVFYDSIEEMPHRRYMKFNKEMMRANEVGNTTTDVIKRIDRAMGFIGANEGDKAMKELSNARMAYNYSQAEEDITTSGLKNTLEVLQRIGLTKKEVDSNAESIKKKSNKSLGYSFLSNLREKISSIIRR
jgi:hypothetical protein